MKFDSVIYNDKIDEQMMKVVIKELFAKIKKVLIKAGLELIYKVLQLWYVLQKPGLPCLLKATIISALTYFILPVDSIPDFLPSGFVDDAAAIAFALSIATTYIDGEVNEKARKKLVEMLTNVVC
ncbi:DUF1232 domain-containing protein [bacterium]|nr:DUF1232 domain-containing protein [bacterium]